MMTQHLKLVSAIALATTLQLACGQTIPQPPPPIPAPSGTLRMAGSESPKLTRFSLDFPGGTPAQLVTAIEKAMGRPLNVIIPDRHALTTLPALKMSDVNVSELFAALQSSSYQSEAVVTGQNVSTYSAGRPIFTPTYQIANTAYGFRSQGTPTDDTIWYFFVEKPALIPTASTKACRFYMLAPFLDEGLTVDDITTAIQTGWKMLGDKDNPNISFHKDTKLLIAVGDPAKLETIDSVLKALQANPRLQSEKSSSDPGATSKATAPAKSSTDSAAESAQ